MAATCRATTGARSRCFPRSDSQPAWDPETQIQKVGRVTPGVTETIRKLLTMVTKLVERAVVEGHTADQLLVFTVPRAGPLYTFPSPRDATLSRMPSSA